MRVAVTGLPFFGKRVVASLRRAGMSALYVPTLKQAVRDPRRLLYLARADVVYAISPNIRKKGPLDLVRRLRKPIVVHWVGSDVLHATKACEEGRESRALIAAAEHWADAPWLADELAAIGVVATERPLPMPIAIGEPVELPTTHRVLVFVPANPHQAYDVEGTLSVIEALPDLQFTMVGGYVPARSYANLTNAGYVQDMASVYRGHSIYMRLSHHDGLAHSVVEALSFGRQVVWTYGLAGVTRAANAAEAVEALRVLTARAPELNEVGLKTADAYRAERTVTGAVAELQRIAGRE